ncbi:MAG: hypothetical protein VCA35_02590 [Roseibacillus sp.]
MNSRPFRHSGSRTLMISTVLLVAAGTFASMAVIPFGAGKRARLARDMNNVRQVKFTLDGFATDFDGQYPNKDTGMRVIEGGTDTKFSNDYFRQLFLAGTTESEEIFWVSTASVCTKKKPDDVVKKGGKVVPAEVLRAGDCGWAYMTGQTNTSNVGRILLLSAYSSTRKEFEKKLYDGKIVVVRVDGSVKAIQIDAQGHLSSQGEDLLSGKSRPWKGSGEDPAKLLIQPKPAN